MQDRSAAFLNSARAMIPALAEREPATLSARHVPPETIADFHSAGILRLLQPRRYGGHQENFCLFSRIIEILAEGCAATAWVYAVLAEHQWIIACMPQQAQEDVWRDDPLAVASSSLAPRETARTTAGGWRLSGRFPFSSRLRACAVGDHRRALRRCGRQSCNPLLAGSNVRDRDRR